MLKTDLIIKKTVIPAGIIALFLSAVTAGAAEYFVSISSGYNTNSGTAGQPWQTISYAAGRATAGDTVHVLAGNYGSETVVIANSGTADLPIVFKAEGEVVLEDTYTAKIAFSMNGKSYITINGFTIKKYNNGIWYENCPGACIINNTVSESWGGGGYGIVNRYTDGALIENNTVFNSGKYNIYVYRSDQVTLRGNKVYNDWSIAQSNPDTTSDYGFKYDYVTNSLSENNLSYNSEWHGWRLRHSCFNNTFTGDKSYNNGGYGFEMNDNIDGNTFINCMDDGDNPGYPPHKSAVGIGRGFAVYDKSDNNVFINCSVKNEDKGFDVRACWYDEGQWGYNVATDENTGAYIGGYSNYESRNNKFTNCTVENVNYGFRMYSPGNIMEKNTVIGSNIFDYHIEIGPETKIIDPLNEAFTVKLSSPISALDISFTDNKVFSHSNTSAQAVYQSTWSWAQMNGVSGSISVQTYALSAAPAAGSLTVTVNSFDAAHDSYSFTAASTELSNPVWFKLGVKIARAFYNVKRDGADFSVIESSSDRKVFFRYEGGWDTEHTFEFKPAPIPSAPRGLSVVSSNKQAALSWQAPESDGGSPVTGYKIFRNGLLLAQTGAVTSFVDSDVANGTRYYYVIYALNSNGESPKSDEVTALLETRPGLTAQKPYAYPVPYISGKHTAIYFSNLLPPSKIEIYSIDGILLYEKEVDELTYSFVPEGIAAGVYVYKIKNSKRTNSGKIVIIR